MNVYLYTSCNRAVNVYCRCYIYVVVIDVCYGSQGPQCVIFTFKKCVGICHIHRDCT